MDTIITDQIRCGKLPFFRGSGDKHHPTIPGFMNVNISSSSPRWNSLSPMKLGPFYVSEEMIPSVDYPSGPHLGWYLSDKPGYQVALCQVFENWWQGSKIYDIDVDYQGNVRKSFLERRAKMMADFKGHRRGVPKGKGTPIAALFNARIVDYYNSRPYYCYCYEFLVTKQPDFYKIVEMYNQGMYLHIIGYDGYDIPMTKSWLLFAYQDTSRPFGHELVLCCILINFRPWVELHPLNK